MTSFTFSALTILVAIFGLGFLMVVHETGHFLVARYFGMRVKVFSIGFGPALWKRQPKGSETTYQIAIIPFLAYVQIVGMNPLEDNDPKDKGSYANASLLARILTIFAGPLANYLVASILFFGAFVLGGRIELTTMVKVMPGEPAAEAKMVDGDKIVEVAGEPIKEWERVRELISARAGQPVDIVIERNGVRMPMKITPKAEGKDGHGRIGVVAQTINVPVPVGQAAILSLEKPPQIVAGLVVGLARIIRGQEKAELSGPVGITKEIAKALRSSFADYLHILGALSAYLAGFNLLPVPALDGGRLMFLGYELTTRKRPNARIEAYVHAVGLAMLLALLAVVTVVSDIGRPGP
ncbi:MAG: site-2 protease family protein [Deltaproteobacteria bacterium]|nr:site-2 protease family protein [Deltaproteobacteria bacterium]